MANLALPISAIYYATKSPPQDFPSTVPALFFDDNHVDAKARQTGQDTPWFQIDQRKHSLECQDSRAPHLAEDLPYP